MTRVKKTRKTGLLAPAKKVQPECKKPIQLISPEQLAATPTPAPFDRKAALAELSAIENDERLQALLDRADDGEQLSAAESRYVEERTERFAQLADQLGIELDDSDDDLDFDDEFEDDDV